ncbi:transglutaminase domain-containing protein [Maridesulfovibrio sp.]|uniref:transglutaminase domain-containing protein n=1 Tax=Maridesulfovibrio sp. TaxID=2795000 RepID=UPI002A188CD2|nr:transglutaminase domain-containing protein [Maridesulfovibrio sp.]
MISLKNISYILAAIYFCASLCACSTKNNQDKFSPYSASTTKILETSGSNRAQLESFISRYTENPEKRQAAQFLVSNLPPSDRAALSAKELSENLDYAFLARESTEWGKDISWNDFLHYVLPHRVSQEKAVSWREQFYNELLPIVAECTSMEEAVLAVNRWCFSKTGFKSTQRWDQNPLMTINRGWGRCEEAVILTVCALRSVGIPARQAMVPAWQHSNDNHTWTEVQVDGKWHYIESANPDYGLDHAWFSGSVRKAPLVISYAYGNASSTDYPILGRSFGCTLINTTARYAPASRTEVLVLDSKGNPLPETKIFFSVLNYASFRPVASKTTDAEGKADITLGPGSVLISAANGDNSAYSGSIWIPGEQAVRSPVMLRMQPDNKPEGTISFKFVYNDTIKIPTPPKNSEGAQKTEFDSIKNRRLQNLSGMEKSAEFAMPDYAPAIANSGLNTPQVMLSVSTCPTANRNSLFKSISIMPAADLLTITDSELIENALFSDLARQEAESKSLKYPDNIFELYVLNPRIMYEQQSSWRKSIHQRFNLTKIGGLEKLLKKIRKFNTGISTVQRGALGNSLSPVYILDTGKASSLAEICILNTAILRSAGIPARFLDEQGWIEFYDGENWKPFYPLLTDQTGNVNATSESKDFYSNWQTIKFKLPYFENNKREPQYFKDFSVSKLIDKTRFQIIEKTVQGKMNHEDKTWEISTPHGDYYLISVQRNTQNEPTISVHKIGK